MHIIFKNVYVVLIVDTQQHQYQKSNTHIYIYIYCFYRKFSIHIDLLKDTFGLVTEVHF